MDLASMFSELALIAIFLVSITTAFQNHTCYFPDGSVAQYGSLAFVQCKETSVDGVTHCCNPNDICTVAGYCVGGAGVFYRGGCTDKTWTSNLCPLLCATVETNIFANFYPCTPGQFSHDNWTCDNCDNPTFHFEPGGLFVPQIEAATTTITVTTASPETGIATVTSSATGAASALPNVGSCPGSCPTHNGTLIGVGVGLGVALALLSITALFGFLVERRKRQAVEKIATQKQKPNYNLKRSCGDEMIQEADSQSLAHQADSQPRHEIGI